MPRYENLHVQVGHRAPISASNATHPLIIRLIQPSARPLRGHPEVAVIEDDYVAGAPYVPLHQASAQWAVIRSASKVLGPDLRVAPMAGDALTISQAEGRQLLGSGWVSHLLQQTAAVLDPAGDPHHNHHR